MVGDVMAVIKHLGQQKAIIVGHDWGGVVAWQLAINVPQVVDRSHHPEPAASARAVARARAQPEQQKNSAYARRFQHGRARRMSLIGGSGSRNG